MAVTNMKKMMARFSMKSVFLVLLLLFFVYLLSTYFLAKQLPPLAAMAGWYEGMATEKADDKKTEKDTKTMADTEKADDKKAAPAVPSVPVESKSETKATENGAK